LLVEKFAYRNVARFLQQRFNRPLRRRPKPALAQKGNCAEGGEDVNHCGATSIFIKNSLNDVMKNYYFCPVMRM
jgi:hypothetical protein